jgi:FlaA1/EpsC-like NDP-sugar epimerase
LTERARINWPRLVLAGIDVALINLGVIVAFWVRYEGTGYLEAAGHYFPQAFYASLLVIGVFYLFGLYNRIWVHASTEAMAAVCGATFVGTGVLALYAWLFAPMRLPHGVVLLTWLLWTALIGGSRFGWRVIREAAFQVAPNGGGERESRRIIIYGAGSAGAGLARQIRGNGHDLVLVGMVDDDPFKWGMLVRGARVLGAGKALPELAKTHRVDEVIIAIPSASGAELRRIVEHCAKAGVRYKILPSILEAASPTRALHDAREVDIADLLGRSPKEYPLETYGEYLRGQVVLVTGAGGSIGSEICRQVARFAPKQLVLLGRGENRIHSIYRELRQSYRDLETVPVIANIASAGAARAVFETYSPTIVIHAAAHKHVYLMEQQPVEAVRNNIFGTANLTQLALEFGVKRFIMVSTDKAVTPTSVMGASKRCCEILVRARQDSPANHGTVFTTVRFGNVIGSAGSVLTIFQTQLRNHQPLTITDPEATRYFMTIPEAALLVLQSGGIGHGGETFVLDMGEPIRIRDLAAELIRLHGGDPDDPSNYRYIGLGPGEKLHESLVCDDETEEHVTEHIMRVVCCTDAVDEATVDGYLHELEGLVAVNDEERVLERLFAICHEAASHALSNGIRH